MQIDNVRQGDYDPQKKRMRAAAACTACRQIKIKCTPSTKHSKCCQRCSDLNLQCVYTSSLRSRAGRQDSVRDLKTTVSQLQRELNDVRTLATQHDGQRRQGLSGSEQNKGDSHCIGPIDTMHIYATPRSSTDSYPSVDTSSKSHYEIEGRSDHNPLNMLYEASMRTYLDERDEEATLTHSEAALTEGQGSLQRRTEEEHEPELIRKGIIGWDQARQLHSDYFQHCNQHILILDSLFHTFEVVMHRSSFLWTVICYVASRYSRGANAKSEAICEVAMQMAREEMLTSDSVDTVQGLLLLSAWCRRFKPSGDQIAWMLSGAAIRMAIGAKLHEDLTLRKRDWSSSSNVKLTLETFNRQRTWLLCYASDRSISALTGNQPMMREEVLIRNCRSWCQQKDSRPWDAGISCYVELQKMQSRQFEQLYTMSSFESSSSHGGMIDIVKMFNEQLNEWREEWTVILSACVEKASMSGAKLDSLILDNVGRQLPLRLGHARLVLNSFALSQVAKNEQSKEESAQLVCNCWLAAKDVVYSVSLGSNMRYSPDTQFIMVAFACVTLLKLKQRSFLPSFNYLDTQEIRNIVSQTATALEELAIDREHSPALFASFLRRVLEMDEMGESKASSTSGDQRNTASVVSNRDQQSIVYGQPCEGDFNNADLLWLISSEQLLFNNAFYSAPSQACLGDDFWDSLLPNLSGPSIGTPSWLARNKNIGQYSSQG